MTSTSSTRARLRALTVALVLAPFAPAAPPSSAPELPDDFDLQQTVNLFLDDVEEVEVSGLGPELRAIGAVVDRKVRDLKRMHLFHATTEVADGQMQRLTLGVYELDGPLDGALLSVAVAPDGSMARARLTRHERFEGEDAFDWQIFVNQFASLAEPDPEQAPTHEELDASLEARARGPHGARFSALRELRMLMRANDHQLAVLGAALGEGAVDETLWPGGLRESLERLTALADVMGEHYGEGAREAFTRLPQEALAHVDALRDAFEAGDAAAAAGAMRSVSRGACAACHGVETPDGGDLYTTVRAELPGHGLRADAYRIGYDVRALPGEEATCRRVATAMHALRLMIAMLDD